MILWTVFFIYYVQSTVESSGDEADAKPKKSPSKEKPLSKPKVKYISFTPVFFVNCSLLLVIHQAKCETWSRRRVWARSELFHLETSGTCRSQKSTSQQRTCMSHLYDLRFTHLTGNYENDSDMSVVNDEPPKKRRKKQEKVFGFPIGVLCRFWQCIGFKQESPDRT